MADSAGFDAATGAGLSDWAHVEQSIGKILTTPLGSRVMRRDFGSRVFDLVDAKMTPRTALAIYAAVAEALARWEPRFRLSSASIAAADAQGRVTLALTGAYFPRGHLGDLSIVEDRQSRIVLTGGAASQFP